MVKKGQIRQHGNEGEENKELKKEEEEEKRERKTGIHYHWKEKRRQKIRKF